MGKRIYKVAMLVAENGKKRSIHCVILSTVCLRKRKGRSFGTANVSDACYQVNSK